MDRRDATLARLAGRPAVTALLVDFDGSLAPIVDRPQDAEPLPEAVEALAALAAGFAVVAVVSGRSVDFLAPRLPVPGLVLAGLYGAELLRDGVRTIDPRVTPYAGAVERAARAAETRLPATLVERKGGVSVTLHWRTAPERADEVVTLATALAAEHGLDAPLRGRMAIELRAPVPVDKGTVVEGLVEGCRVAAFAGDDAGDLPAFDALDRLARDGRLDESVRIAVRSTEAPAAVVEQADLVVDGPHDLAAFFTTLATRAAPPPG